MGAQQLLDHQFQSQPGRRDELELCNNLHAQYHQHRRYPFWLGEHHPLAARVIPAGAEKSKTLSRSLIDLDLPNVLVVDSQLAPDGNSVILHLRETEGDHAILDVARLKQQTGATTISEVNVLGEEIKTLERPLLIEHFETKFIRVSRR